MTDLSPYARTFSFTGFQANKPASPLPGLQVDRELDELGARVNDFASRITDLVGTDVVGIKGDNGDKGDDGINGRDGIDGKDGKDGGDVAFTTPIEQAASLKPRTSRARWSDEVRITPENCPLDYATDMAPYLRPIINQAAILGQRVIFPDRGNRYIPLGSSVVQPVGAQRSGTTGGVPSGAVLKDSSNVPLKYNVRIEGNGCTLVPLFTGFALDFVPSMSLAEMAANPSWAGYDSAQFDVRNFNFNLNGAPGAQALRLGRQGRSFHDLVFYSKLHGLSLNNVGGANTSPADHGIRFEGYLYGIEMEGWRLNAIGGGLWMVIDATTPGTFQGAFFFKNFQSLGTAARPPLRMSVLAGTSGARSEMRGLHFNDAQIYGAGTLYEATGNANIGDLWFGSGCQWDPVNGITPGSGECAIKSVAAQGAHIFNCFWSNPYIQYFNGPIYRAVTDSNGQSIISNQQFNGGSYTLIDNSGGGLFDLQGLHAGGLKLADLDFQACKGTSYVVMNGADSLKMNGCTSSGETVGDSVISGAAISTASAPRIITAIGNTLKAAYQTSMVNGPSATAQNASNTVNLLY